MSEGSETETCRNEGCNGDGKWRWWNGMGAFAPYCDDCARDELEDRSDFTGSEITRAEDVDGVYALPAGIQPVGESFPTIRTKEAFDTYLKTDGKEPRQCRTSWCGNILTDCEYHEEGSA